MKASKGIRFSNADTSVSGEGGDEDDGVGCTDSGVDVDVWSAVSADDGTSIDIDGGSDSLCGAGLRDMCRSWPGEGDGDGDGDGVSGVSGVSSSDSGDERVDGW